MTQHKATFKSSYTDKYDSRYTELTYEYRGHEYTVIKANNWSACSSEYTIGDKTLAKQHKRAQDQIDRIVENPASEITKPAPAVWTKEYEDKIWAMLGFEE